MDYQIFQIQKMFDKYIIKNCSILSLESIIMLSIKNLIKTCQSGLHAFDLFGIPMQLQVKQKPQYHTVPGSLISLALLIFILYSFINLLVDLFERKSPNVINKVVFSENPEAYPITPDQFLFAVTVADEYGVPIPPSSQNLTFIVRSSFCKRFRSADGTIQSDCGDSAIYKPCSQLNLTSIAQEMGFSELLRAQSWCIDPNEWGKFKSTLEGTPNSEKFNSLVIRVMRCNEALYPGGQCASQTMQEQVLDRGYVAIFLPDRLLDQQVSGNPFKTVTKRISTPITRKQFKNLQANYRRATVMTTENFYYYFPSQESYTTLQFEQQTEYTENYERDDLFYMALYLDDKEIIYYRTYGNILEVLGSIGGLLELLTFLIGFMIKPLNQIASELYLANSIFQFRNEVDQLKSTDVHPEIQGESKLSKFVRILKFKKKNEYYGVIHYMVDWGTTKNLVNQTIDQIYQKLDAHFLVNKIIEIDKLKKLLLTEEQEHLFNCISRPKINLPSHQLQKKNSMKVSRHMNLYDQKVLTDEERLQLAFESYKVIRDLPLNSMNKKLFALMDRDLKATFDEQILQINPIVSESSMLHGLKHTSENKSVFQELEQILGQS